MVSTILVHTTVYITCTQTLCLGMGCITCTCTLSDATVSMRLDLQRPVLVHGQCPKYPAVCVTFYLSTLYSNICRPLAIMWH